MRTNLILSLLIIFLLSSCSIFKRNNNGYEDSGSVKDLSVPPELVLPTRDQNYSIPDAPEAESVDAEEVVEEAVEDSVSDAE